MPQDRILLEEFRRRAAAGEKPKGTVLRLEALPSEPVEGQPRTRRFCFSDGSIDRAGDTIDVAGWVLDDFRKNPVALWAHDSWSPPIGRAQNVGPQGNRLMGDIEFAPAETFDFADTIFRLTEGGFIKAVSVGFNPLEWAYVNEKDRPYGIDFKRQELLEISLVPIPCNAGALVEARAKGIDTRPLVSWAERCLDGLVERVLMNRAELEELRRLASVPKRRRSIVDRLRTRKDEAEWHCAAARDLAIDDSDDWDGPSAEASIFAHAGGDDFDPAIASKGFLAYDASAPKLHGSYKEPFARVTGGELKAVKGGIRAAASRLPQTDIPDNVRDAARAVIDHYEAKMSGKTGQTRRGKDGMGENDPSAGGAVVAGDAKGTCGRGPDEECGMKDPAECAVHAPSMADDEDAEKFAGLIASKLSDLVVPKSGRVLSKKNEGLIRSAADHATKAKALHEEAAGHNEKAQAAHAKAADHYDKAAQALSDVLDAIDDDDDGPDDAGGDLDADDAEKMRARARALAAAKPAA